MFIHPSVDGHLTFFHILAIVNNTMNMDVQIFVQVPAFKSFGSMPRSGIAGSYGNSMFNFFEETILFSTVAALFSFPQAV